MPRDLFEIDLARLDQEWVRQGKDMRDAGEAAAEARHEYAVAKRKQGLVKAELTAIAHRDPAAFDLEDKPRPTASLIAAVVESHAGYQEAAKATDKAKYRLDILEARVVALIDKRKGLENEVKLLGMDYRSDPKPPTDRDVRAVADRAEKAAARKGPEMKRRR